MVTPWQIPIRKEFWFNAVHQGLKKRAVDRGPGGLDFSLVLLQACSSGSGNPYLLFITSEIRSFPFFQINTSQPDFNYGQKAEAP